MSSNCIHTNFASFKPNHPKQGKAMQAFKGPPVKYQTIECPRIGSKLIGNDMTEKQKGLLQKAQTLKPPCLTTDSNVRKPKGTGSQASLLRNSTALLTQGFKSS